MVGLKSEKHKSEEFGFEGEGSESSCSIKHHRTASVSPEMSRSGVLEVVRVVLEVVGSAMTMEGVEGGIVSESASPSLFPFPGF